MHTNSSKILVVDDTAIQRIKARDVFSKTNYEVIECSSGEEAMGHLQKRDIDIVLLDVIMPGISGYEVCRRIREELQMKFLPVIMMSTLQGVKEYVQGMDAGATEFLHKPYNEEELLARVNSAIKIKRLTDRLDDAESILNSVGNLVEARDLDTGDHSRRLFNVCQVLGKELGLGDEEMEVLRRGCILHDIGKIGVPDYILLKRGPLTDKEWTVMQSHPTIGVNICNGLKSMKGTVDIIGCHHEKMNGSGYPYGLSGDEIPKLVRVFQVADVYDALKSERPYKKPFSTERIMETFIEEADKGWWDPEITSVLIGVLNTRPEALECEESFLMGSRFVSERGMAF